MTLAEICLAMEDPGKPAPVRDTRPPGMSLEEYARWLRGLSPLERLDMARELWG